MLCVCGCRMRRSFAAFLCVAAHLYREIFEAACRKTFQSLPSALHKISSAFSISHGQQSYAQCIGVARLPIEVTLIC